MTVAQFELHPEQQKGFETSIKVGILKQLHQEKMLTDDQLTNLLSRMQDKNTCALDKNTCALD